MISRPAAPAARDIVGRELEIDALVHEFGRAHKGKGRLVVISAEAGMGKTTLVDAFVRQLESGQEPARVGRGRCSERLAGSEAYLPVLEALETLQRNEHLGSLTRLIRTLAPTWYAQLAPPSSDSSGARLAAETAIGSQERLKREIAALLEEVGRMQPVVLCFDDVHWADPSTTDLLGYLARRIDEAEDALKEARVVADATSQHAYDAEQRRLEAEVLSLRRDNDAAEAAFRDAFAIAGRQRARWLELRAARGLAQFLAALGRIEEARRILQPVVAELSEGHSTADYNLAVTLLASF